MSKLRVLTLTFLILCAFLSFVSLTSSCKSPTSTSWPSGTPYTYGLYDDFENGKIDTKWSYSPLQYIKVKNDGTGNNVLEVWGTLHMIWPKWIYPDEVDRLGAKIYLLGAFNCDELRSHIAFNVKIPEQGGYAWISEIGIIRKSDGLIDIYGQWINTNNDKLFFRNLLRAEINKWYTVEMKFTKINASELKIEYIVDGIVLAESIPSDSSILLDRERITAGFRYLIVRGQGGFCETSGIGGKCWFDDICGIYGDLPLGMTGGIQLSQDPPSLLEGILMPVKTNRTMTDPYTQKQKIQKKERKDSC